MSETERLPRDRVLPAAAVVTVAAGAAVAADPVVGMLAALAPILLTLLIWRSWARLAWFVGGGLAVFGGAGTVGVPKIAYVGGVIVVAVISWTRIIRSDAEWLVPFRGMIRATVLMSALVLTSGLVATGNSYPSTWGDWMRDGAGYILLAVAPIIALDVAHDIRERTLHFLIGAVGIAVAVGYAIDWLSRRGASELGVDRVIFATSAPALLGMCLALGKVAARERVARWALVACSIPSIMLATGGRSIVTYGAALLGVVGSRRNNRMGVGKALTLAVLAVLAVAWLAPLLSTAATGDSSFFSARMGMAERALQTSGDGDSSYQWRRMVYAQTLELWRQHRWWGVGPGVLGSLDTPLITVAKFGIVGTTAIAIFLATIVAAGRSAGRRYGWAPAHTAVRCFTVVFLVGLPFGSRLEDKGFALTALLGIAAVAVSARDATRASSDADAPSYRNARHRMDTIT